MAFLNYENPLNRRTPSTTMPTLSGGVMKPLMTPTDPAKNPIVDPSNALTEGVGVPPTTTGGIDPAGPQTEGVMTPDTGTDNFLLRSYMASGGSNPALRDQLAQTMAGSGAGPTSGAVGLDTSAPVSTYTGGGPYGGINPTEAPPTGKTGMPSQPHVDTYNQQAPTSAPASDEDAFYADLRQKQQQWADQDAARYGTAPVNANPAAPSAVGPSAAPGAGSTSPGGFMGGQNPSNPGVTTGTQGTWAGGPNVTTARVGFDGLPDINQDFAGQAQAGADAAYKGATQYFDQDFAKEKAANDSQLQAQGFSPGTEAYNRQMELMQRTQDSARTNAAFQAQGVGFQQAGDLLQRALAARQQMVGERGSDADRIFGQSLGIANLGLGARGQDASTSAAQLGAAASANNAQTAANASMYGQDVNANLALRRLGLDENNQNFSQLMQLIASSRGGVNVPNFGSPTPIDVTGANSIASQNANNAANRGAANNNALYTLGGNLLGSYFRSY